MRTKQSISAGLNSFSSSLGSRLSQMGAQNILLLTGRKSYEISGAQAVISKIENQFTITRFCDFEVNPKFEDALKSVSLAKKLNIDTILAVGGGSVIDMAKLTLAFYNSGNNLFLILTAAVKPQDSRINFIAVPTTAGSGSESTHFAVVYYKGEKYSVASPFLLPQHVILDGMLTKSNSPRQRAANGLDALAQCIESYWAAGATEQSRSRAAKAIPVVFSSLESAVKGTISESGLQDMIEAANFAGQAINISKTTAAHAYSYAFTSTYGVPHGQAVWLTLPEVFQIHYNANATNSWNIQDSKNFHTVMERIVNMMHLDKSWLKDELREFVQSLGLETAMQKIGAVSEKERLHISEQVNIERMSNNPVLLTPKIVKKIFAY